MTAITPGTTPPLHPRRRQLFVELVPHKAWEENLRTQVPKAVWDRLRKSSYRRAGYRCEICGESGLDQGSKWPVECHEVWEYDDLQHVQKLLGLTALCPRCHEVKHAGRTIKVRGKEGLQQVLGRLAQINGWTEKQAAEHLQKAFQIWESRYSHQWTLDLSWVLPDRSSPAPAE